jgi:hypothetical protein
MSGEAYVGPPPQEWAGYQRHVTSDVGTLVVLVHAREAGVCGDEDGPWALICDDHGSLLTDKNKRRLWRHARCSDDWCDGCREM